MTRDRLGNRRLHYVSKFKAQTLNERTLHVGINDPYNVREVFVSGAKTGSTLDGLFREWATLLSVALQLGLSLDDYAQNMQREPNGDPCTPFGEVIDHVKAIASPKPAK